MNKCFEIGTEVIFKYDPFANYVSACINDNGTVTIRNYADTFRVLNVKLSDIKIK